MLNADHRSTSRYAYSCCCNIVFIPSYLHIARPSRSIWLCGSSIGMFYHEYGISSCAWENLFLFLITCTCVISSTLSSSDFLATFLPCTLPNTILTIIISKYVKVKIIRSWRFGSMNWDELTSYSSIFFLIHFGNRFNFKMLWLLRTRVNICFLLCSNFKYLYSPFSSLV